MTAEVAPCHSWLVNHIMPLDNLSTNITRPSRSKQDDSKRAAGNSSHVKPPPLAVQSMLKSSTEIGDVGIFAQRPPRVPRSSTQASLAGSSRSLTDPSILSHRPRRYESSMQDGRSIRSSRPPSSGLQRRNSTRSSRSAYQYSASKRFRSSQVPHHNQQYMLAPPSQHHLHSHRSVTSLRSDPSRSGISMYHSRPRHAARAPSPAINNLYDYRHAKNHRNDTIRKEAASPISFTSTGQSFQDFRAEHNVSRMSSKGGPSPSCFGARYQPGRRPSFPLAITPASGVRQNEEQILTTSPSSTPASPTGSIVPFYYDYSESFHGQEALLGPSNERSSYGQQHLTQFGSEEGSVLQGPSGTMVDSSWRPTELSIKHIRRSSEQSARHSRKASSRSNRSMLAPSQQPIEEEYCQHETSPYDATENEKVNEHIFKLISLTLTVIERFRDSRA